MPGSDPVLTNPRSDRVKAVRALAGRSARRRHGLFLVEGPQGVREAVRHGAGAVRDVYLTQGAAERYPEIVADGAGLFVHLCSPEVVDAMSPDAQGVLAVVRPVPVTAADALDPAGGPRPALVAVLANVRDPGNAGTVIRCADAAGAGAVILAGDSVDVYNPKTVRSTAGSLFHLPVVGGGMSLPDAVAHLHAADYLVLAADGTGDWDLDDLADAADRVRRGPAAGRVGAGMPDLTRPTAWVFGNEAWGLSARDLALADAVVRVPIRGLAESLNLATAAAVCLYASSRAHRR